MNQNPYQQLSAANNEDYEILIPVISTDHYYCLAADNPSEQTYLYATGNPQAMYQQTPQQIYSSTSDLETGQTFSSQAIVEQFLPSAQPPQVYPERTPYPSLTSYDSIPTVERQSTSTSITSFTTFSDDEHDYDLTSASPRDEAVERRKDRRRAQNRAAQRAFRTRKEETIKEGAVRLEALQNDLTRVQNANAGLSETASNISAQILRLQWESTQLKRWSSSMMSSIRGSTDGGGDYNGPLTTPQEGGINLDIGIGTVESVQWQSSDSRTTVGEPGVKAGHVLGVEDAKRGLRGAGAGKPRNQERCIMVEISDAVTGIGDAVMDATISFMK